MSLRRLPWLGIAATVVVVAVDQVLKAVVVSSRDSLPWRLFSDIRIEYVENTGVSFSLFRDYRWLLVTIVGLVSAALAVALFKAPRRLALPIGILLGGSLGNLIDRIRLGRVVDYIGMWSYPTFNFADIAIGVGAALLVLSLIRGWRR